MASADETRSRLPQINIGEVLLSRLGQGYVFFMYLVLVVPMVIIVGVSLTAGDYFSFPPEGLSLGYYTQILGSSRWLSALELSLTIAVGASLLSTTIGGSLAFALNRYDITYGKFIWGLGVIPLLVPPVIVAVALMSFFLLIGIWGTRLSIILAHGIVFSPFSFVLVSSGLDEIDSEVEEVSRNLGATKAQTLRYITMPLIASNILVAILFTFILSLNEYLIALLVGGPALDTIPVVIFSSLRYNYTPAIASMSVIYMLLTIGFVILINYRLDGQLW
jgi:ABC-type spermidine/putrescine transport system permease subunit II